MDDFKKDKRPFKPRVGMRWPLIWVGILLALLYVAFWVQTRETPYKPDTSEIRKDIEENLVRTDGKYKPVFKGDTLTGYYITNDAKFGEKASEKSGKKFTITIPESDKDLIAFISQNLGVYYQKESVWLQNLIYSILPFILVVAIFWIIISRQMRSASGGALSFGKSKAKMLTKDNNKVTFADVAGVDEAKEELVEVVEFLKDPKKFTRLGGRIPKGVLLVGPPGCGKTLLAKSIAGEADVPFFTISGSDFVEMFVGVGASRVRDMFEQARKNAPCIVFMDEIDAMGRHRGAGIGGGHDEREQTLNQLLVEMDGFDTKEGVIIMAATNRPDILDPALLRSGRFDRQVVIDLPDLNGREAILKVHARKIKLDTTADLRKIARGTPGFSGADLENIVNEAALLAARSGKDKVGIEELEEARDKVRWGRERRSRTMSDEEKKITAYHEAGHALVLELIPETEPLHKVTIIPRGVAFLGATMQLPERDKYLQKKKELLGQISGLMGGRIAEELIFDDITSGAAMDLRTATKIARAMVTELGMSEKLGTMAFGEKEELIFLGKEIAQKTDYSEAIAIQIDKEVRRIIDECYARAKTLLQENKDKLIKIAEALLEYEVLEGNEITEIIKGTWDSEKKAAEIMRRKASEDLRRQKAQTVPKIRRNKQLKNDGRLSDLPQTAE